MDSKIVEEQQLMRAVLDHAPWFMGLLEEEGDELRIVSQSASLRAATGEDRPLLRSVTWAELADIVRRNCAEARRLQQPMRFEVQWKQWRLRTVVSALPCADGAAQRFTFFSEDITEQLRRFEEDRRHENAVIERHRTLVSLSLLTSSHVDNWLEEALPAAAAALGVDRLGFWQYGPGHASLRCMMRYYAAGQRFDSGTHFSQAQAPSLFAALRKSPVTAVRDLKHDALLDDASSSFLDTSAHASMSAQVAVDGELLGVLRFAYDAGPRLWTTEEQQFAASVAHLLSLRFAEAQRRAAEHQLRVADRMASLGTLAAGVAHEINNPLGFVMGNLEYLRNELPPRETSGDVAEMHDAVEDGLAGARRVRDIVADLKALSRDTDDSSPSVVDLHQVVSLAMRMAQSALRHRATLSVDVPAGLLVRGNESRLGQVFLNLVVNAAQAMPERAAAENHVRISARRCEREVEITVSDNGAGMTETVRRRVFDPFFTTKPLGVGTGLGLSIAHGIVTAMAGTITVASVAGSGTTFTVRMPSVSDRVDDAPSKSSGERSGAGRRRILVVDDEVMSGLAIRRLLSDHEVEAVTDPREALRRLEAGTPYDLVLCDLMMPFMTGMELYATVEEKFPSFTSRMIFITGGAVTENAQRFVSRADVRTLDKPFDMDQLRSMVTSTLAH